ncbi:glycosyltransferase [Acidocella sp.]
MSVEYLARKYDIVPAWIGAAIAAQMFGDAALASKAVCLLLSRHCIPDDPGFPAFAEHIALRAGFGGYQGYLANGSLVSHGNGRLLGAHPNLAAISRIEGVVEYKREGLSGWAVRPAWPGQPPRLRLVDATGQTLSVKCGKPLPLEDTSPFLPRYAFRISARTIKEFQPPFTLSGDNSPPLLGSPIDHRPLQAIPVCASTRGASPKRLPHPATLALVMPVYGGSDETQAAIRSVLAAATPGTKFIVVNDCSPEPSLTRWLEKLALKGKIELLHHTRNLGFCAAANTGLMAAAGCDVLLLNSDILLPRKTIETLRAIAYSAPDIGTVTPLSNEATICGYPSPNVSNSMPDMKTANLFDRLAKKINGLAWVEVPTAVGFCMYIRHDCLEATGRFRTEIFAQGYGEENDFCLRARQLGYRHAAALGAYVAHKGGVSFKSAANALILRNLKILNKLFPGYQDMISNHVKLDPASPGRSALDEARLRHARINRKSVLLISHAHGGGVAKQVQNSMSSLRQQGFFPLLLTTEFPENPEKTPYPWRALLCEGVSEDYPNLTFTLPSALPQLIKLLRTLNVVRVELHHMLGQHESVREIASSLNLAQDIIIHDYASFCPRVNLLNRPEKHTNPRYCGEPDMAGCTQCCQADKANIFETLPIPQLLNRSHEEFMKARRVIAPSMDTARRLTRHFPDITPHITPWEDDTLPTSLKKPRSGQRKIVILGGIAPAKGLNILLDCASDLQRRHLPLEFIVIGSSSDDDALLSAGIKVTGAYKPETLSDLIEEIQPDLAFIPSIWPETWCFVLGEAWKARLHTVVFDLGAQAERVRATGRGAILPLGLPPERINNALLNVSF